MLVGCGGTGGFVAEGLCRLLAGKGYRLALVDHDRVEESNLGRQNFFRSELGHFKAEALAKRLARNYGMEIDYLCRPVEKMGIDERGHLTIGCVDNAAAREALQYAGRYPMGGKFSYWTACDGWLIDAGNGRDSGQVLVGNGLENNLSNSFYEATGVCYKLPLPTIQQPGLLAPDVSPRRLTCAERIAAREQSPVINQVMASLVLTFVHKLLNNTLGWMAAYVDLEQGAVRTVDASPEAVSRITGRSIKYLTYTPRRIKPDAANG